MKKIDQLQLLFDNTGVHPGYDLLRYIALPELLGKDQETVLYILGKNTSRSLELDSIDTLIHAFKIIGLGELVHTKETRSEDVFTLTSPLISSRKEANIDQHYYFESGLISGTMETIHRFQCEAEETIKPRKDLVEFTVKHYR